MSDLYVGLMSGTSLDGIDAGLVDFSQNKCRIIDFIYQPFSAEFKQQLTNLCHAERPIYLHEYGKLDHQLGEMFANITLKLLHKNHLKTQQIAAIGSHGLTTHHAANSNYPFSLQIGDPNIIAEETGITTVADFRRRDIAAGGQGAPLVPAFHQYLFAEHQPVCIVNIGGIANISYLDKDKVLGFDTGPGNTLMDYWIDKNIKQPFDDNGNWARSGRVCQALLKQLKNDPYFSLAPAKSTGKEYFSPHWLEKHLEDFTQVAASDIQATLCQLTADTICKAIKQYALNCNKVIICGGGSYNTFLMELLQQNLHCPVSSSHSHGIDADQVEAIAFAWLARQTINQLPGNICSATGAHHPVILGGIYPGKNQ
jgi:anhydro-N-acetylmuramic acid kinase